jgi:hypothetical protein
MQIRRFIIATKFYLGKYSPQNVIPFPTFNATTRGVMVEVVTQ